MLNPQGDKFKQGETAYIRVRFRGVDTDVTGHVVAIVEPIDAKGNVVDGDRYEMLLDEGLLTKAGVLQEMIEERVKVEVEKRNGR